MPPGRWHPQAFGSPQVLHLRAANLEAFLAQLHREPAEAVVGVLPRQFILECAVGEALELAR